MGWYFGGVSDNEIIDIIVVDDVGDIIAALATLPVQKVLLSVSD